MRHGPRQAALCKLHHPRKLCLSHPSLWGIIFLLPPFSGAGGNLHCLASAVYSGQSWLGYPRAKAALLLSKDLPASPPGQDRCACFPFLCQWAAPKLEPAPGKCSSQFVIPVLFTGVKALTSALGDGQGACPSLTQWWNPLQWFPDYISSWQQSPKEEG